MQDKLFESIFRESWMKGYDAALSFAKACQENGVTKKIASKLLDTAWDKASSYDENSEPLS